MSNKKIRTKLFTVKIIFFIMMVSAASVITWSRHYLEAILLAIFSFLVLLFFYKCPFCGYSLDFRFQIKEETCCPMCGKRIASYDRAKQNHT